MISPYSVELVSIAFKHLLGLGIINVKTVVDDTHMHPFTSRIYLTCDKDLSEGSGG
jgi:hypothetical protein